MTNPRLPKFDSLGPMFLLMLLYQLDNLPFSLAVVTPLFYNPRPLKWPASCISDSSGVHSFQMTAHSNTGNQSSNVILISSAVNGSIGGAFSHRGV